MNLNDVTLAGRVGNKETKIMQSGKKIVSVSLAVNKYWKDQEGNKKEKANWFSITFFEPLSDIVDQHVVKGQVILVKGELEVQSYEKDGQKRYATKVIAKSMQMGSKPKSNEITQEQVTEVSPESSDDDLPF